MIQFFHEEAFATTKCIDSIRVDRLIHRLIADAIFLLHVAVVFVITLGWLWPGLWPLYMCLLIVTLISDFILGYCILSKWEFDLRKRLNPHIEYEYAFASYYTYKLTNKRIGNELLANMVYLFLSVSIILALWTHYMLPSVSK